MANDKEKHQKLGHPDSYEDFLFWIYHELDAFHVEPLQLGYDILNAMALDLYQSNPENRGSLEDFYLEDAQRVGTDLRKLRESLGIGQRELARALHIDHRPLSDIERGKYRPSFNKIYGYLNGIRVLTSQKHHL